MYKIGEFSRLCKVSVKTLHYYDSEGLLCPDYIDKFTSYRYYSASKLVTLNQILALKELGFSLAEIRNQLSAKNYAAIIELIEAKQRELLFVKSQTESQLKRLTTIKEFILREKKIMTNVIIKIQMISTLHQYENCSQIVMKLSVTKIRWTGNWRHVKCLLVPGMLLSTTRLNMLKQI